MENGTTLIYYTDGSLEDSLAELVRNRLLKTGLPIVSVSQEPLDFGTNVCIGKIGRSYSSIQSQILAGLCRAETKYVALCEHDTLYPDGCFDFVPPGDGVFFYNRNRIFVIAKKGPQYGEFIKATVSNPTLGHLICNRALLIHATQIRRELLLRCTTRDLPSGWDTPGFSFPHEFFTWRKTEIPSIDILHNNNFTVRTGTYRPDELSKHADGWGKWEDILKEAENDIPAEVRNCT